MFDIPQLAQVFDGGRIRRRALAFQVGVEDGRQLRLRLPSFGRSCAPFLDQFSIPLAHVASVRAPFAEVSLRFPLATDALTLIQQAFTEPGADFLHSRKG